MWAARRVAWGVVNVPLEVAAFFVNDVAHMVGQIADWTYDKAWPEGKMAGTYIKNPPSTEKKECPLCSSEDPGHLAWHWTHRTKEPGCFS